MVNIKKLFSRRTVKSPYAIYFDERVSSMRKQYHHLVMAVNTIIMVGGVLITLSGCANQGYSAKMVNINDEVADYPTSYLQTRDIRVVGMIVNIQDIDNTNKVVGNRFVKRGDRIIMVTESVYPKLITLKLDKNEGVALIKKDHAPLLRVGQRIEVIEHPIGESEIMPLS